jgi:hypothetical protein
VKPGETASAGFDLVRHVAKEEAPLVSLAANDDLITAIAQVTFYGQDHAGHEWRFGEHRDTFGNFGDPD